MFALPPFRLAGVPVTINGWFIILVLFFASSAQTPIGALALGLATIASLLVHEMGHALMARRFDLNPAITLHGMGGVTHHRAARSRRPLLLVTLAGSALQLLVAGLFYGIMLVIPGLGTDPGLIGDFWFYFLWVSVVWAVFNLLPIWPLDGGLVLLELLGRRGFSPKGRVLTHRIGLAGAVALAVFGLTSERTFLVLIAALMGYENWRALKGRGIGPHSMGMGGRSGAVRAQGAPAMSIGGVSKPSPVILRVIIAIVVSWVVFAFLGTAPRTTAGAIFDAMRLEPMAMFTEFKLWQPLTYLFLHEPNSIGHVLSNGLGLWFLASPLEQRWGGKDMAIFLIAAGVGAGVISALIGLAVPDPFGTPIIGISGALMACVAAFAMTHKQAELLLFFAIPFKVKWLVPAVVVFDLIAYFVMPNSNLAIQTHFAGLFMGWILVTGNWRPTVLRGRWRHRLGPKNRDTGPDLRVLPGGRGASRGPTLH